MHHVVTPGFVDRPRWSDGNAGQMEGEAGWWITCGKIGLPPLARVKGVGRPEQQSYRKTVYKPIIIIYIYIYIVYSHIIYVYYLAYEYRYIYIYDRHIKTYLYQNKY